MGWTTADLLSSAKLRAFEPDSNGHFTDAEWLRLAYDELVSEVFPLVLASQGDFRVTDQDDSIVANQATYRTPKRAHGGRHKDVLFVDGNGDEFSLPLVNIEELGHLSGLNAEGYRDLSYYYKDDSIGLHPVPTNATGTLRQRHYMRPGTLVTEASAAQVTAVASTVQLSFTSGTIPAAWTTANTFDVISNTGTFRTIAKDLTVATVTTGAITFSSTLDTGIEVGDWVALAGESPIPQVPEVVHPYLAQRAAVRALAAVGDKENLQFAMAELGPMERRLDDTLAPRSDGEAKVIVPRHSPLRSSDDPWRRWTR